MNSNQSGGGVGTLDRIHRLLDTVTEEENDGSLSQGGSISLRNFAQETAAASKPKVDHEMHSAMPMTVDLHNFPNADFYYKLVAKVNGRLYSIFDGKTEYVVGQQLYEPVQASHQGGYYVYPSLKEAIFADVPFNKGGHFLAPRTVIKVIAWGNFICYSQGKMAFSYLLPVEELGLPIGYKNTKESVKEAMKLKETVKYKSKESHYDRRLVLKNIQSDPYERNKFDNYFGKGAAKRLDQPIVEKKKQPKQVDPLISEAIQNGLEKMIADLEDRFY